MSVPVYLDNAATTPVDARVAAAMAAVLNSDAQFGNAASSTHEFGDVAAALLEDARAQVAAAVGADADEVIFTSGATEANNLGLFGAAQYYQDYGRHIITSRVEHKAVLDPARELERRGYKVTYLEPDAEGIIAPQALSAALQPDTVLVSLMLVNNEIGVIQDIKGMADICSAHGKARLHVDAAQAVGKIPLDFHDLGADLLSLSAHKAYGPKGVGALLRRHRGEGTHLKPQQLGGGQERGLRSGTSATHQVVGMGVAFELAQQSHAAEALRIAQQRERLWRGIETLQGVFRNGSAQYSVPHILNVSFEGVEGESLLAAVSPHIAVSTGSACTSASAQASYVLRALGRSSRLSESSLRFGLGRFTRDAHIDIAIDAVNAAVRHLRRVSGY